MKTLILVSTLCLGAAAQEAQVPNYPTKEQLVLEYFTPQYASPRDLTTVASQLYGDRLAAINDSGEAQFVAHFIALGNTIVVQDTKPRIARIVETLMEMDMAQAGQSRPKPVLERMEYSVRHAAVQSIASALDSISNLAYWPVTEKRMLVLKGSQEDLSAAKALIAKLDVPVPQVTITCHLIRGSSEARPAGQLPRELTENLARILPMPAFEMLSVNAVQSTVSGSTIELTSQAKQDIAYTVRLVPTAYDAQSKHLTFSNCYFLLQMAGRDHVLQTSLTLGQGEYVVLGAFGDDPIFVVLRMVPN